MPIKIFFTSDIHLGLSFRSFPEVAGQLIEARFTALEKMVKTANNEKCDLFVIAGDMFEKTGVNKKTIVRPAQILSEFEGKLVLVLPGNHDYYSGATSELWSTFKASSADNTLILTESSAYSLKDYDIDATIYAAPCDKKHSADNRVNSFTKDSINKETLYQIGIAHGSLEGVSPDFDNQYFPMTEKELNEKGTDVWLLGHTHKPYPLQPDKNSRVFYAGTPEPDSFNRDHGGTAWIIEIDEQKNIRSNLLETGTYRFYHDSVNLESDDSFSELVDKFSGQKYKQGLVKLNLTGRLSKDELNKLNEIKKSIENEVFYLEWENDTTEKITRETIDSHFSESSFPHRLLSSIIDDTNNELRDEALTLAMDLLREAKQ